MKSFKSNLNNEKKFIEIFSKNVDETLLETCNFLSWDLRKTFKKELCVICPFNESHQIPEKTLEKHLNVCEWKSLGYTQECISLSDSTLPLESPSTIKFDMSFQCHVLLTEKQKNPTYNIGLDEKFIPQTSDRFTNDFTSDEKRALYDYVIAHTVRPNIGQDINTDINQSDKTTEKQKNTVIIELLAAERNLKRRRAKYKGVHTNKKSHLEIIREIIEQQMEMFREHISEKFGNFYSNQMKQGFFFSSSRDEKKEHKSHNYILNEKKIKKSFKNNKNFKVDEHCNNKVGFESLCQKYTFKDFPKKYYDNRDLNKQDYEYEKQHKKSYSHHSYSKKYYQMTNKHDIKKKNEKNKYIDSINQLNDEHIYKLEKHGNHIHEIGRDHEKFNYSNYKNTKNHCTVQTSEKLKKSGSGENNSKDKLFKLWHSKPRYKRNKSCERKGEQKYDKKNIGSPCTSY